MHRSYEELIELKESYRYGYRQMIKWCTWLTIAVVMLTIALVSTVLFTGGVEHKYFAVNQDGGLVAMDRPKIDEDVITGFAVNSVRSAYTFTFNNWREELQETRNEYFTSVQDFQGFVSGLKEANILSVVRQDNLSVTATTRSAPVIQKRKMQNGWRTWDVTFGVNLRYVSSAKQYSQNGTARVTIQARPVDETPNGIAVKRIVIQ